MFHSSFIFVLTGYSHDFQSFASTNANEYQLSNRFQAYYESLHANRITLANNASFIHAIIQLKALAEVQSTIPMNKYISSIWNLTATKQALGSTSSNRTSQLQSEPLSTSNDSGFHTVTEDCYHCKIINKTRTEHFLLTLSLFEIVGFYVKIHVTANNS